MTAPKGHGSRPNAITRRAVLTRGAAGVAATTVAVAAPALADHTAAADGGMIRWRISDDVFWRWHLFEGDEMLLSPVAEPMRDAGIWAVPRGDDFRLDLVRVQLEANGEPSGTAFWYWHPGLMTYAAQRFNRFAPDAPLGHRILWHAPAYGRLDHAGSPDRGTRHG